MDTQFEGAEMVAWSGGELLRRTEIEESPRRDFGVTLNERASVLVVEDDLAARSALRGLLESEFTVLEAADGMEALARAREAMPDLILADLVMPRLDGLELLKRLQQGHPAGGSAVVFLSATQDEASIVSCLEAGAADFVIKPAHGRELVARLKRALKQQRERIALEELAQTDPLTGLANFRALGERLEAELARAHRYGTPLAALMLDLDHLKQINDRFGHEAGNRAILQISHRLKETLRSVDFAARYGGDEFIVLLPHQTASEAAVLAERLRARLGTLVLGDDVEPFPLTLSVGVAAHYQHAPKRTGEELLEAADSALYEAKRRGRNRVTVFERDLQAVDAASSSERQA